FALNQQATLLATHPLAGKTCAHSSSKRFAGIDVWVRDLRQVIEDAKAKAQPSDGKVVLVGYSFGALRVGRALDPMQNPHLGANGSQWVFVAPLCLQLGGLPFPTEDVAPEPPAAFATFPLTLNDVTGSDGSWNMLVARNDICTGHIIDHTQAEVWSQTLE